ncbi:hypothetical protein Cgig2_010990 [Carnegiea gigantea]|uniref:Uncharacterized protein n=1 Tax=Carnegiea gigantea TaxID=171969 RepID=A0A9Q1JY12_9CARY|nr:hypothetical protein Cgig2_010990 [Carnegiea gigantea]
MGVSFDTPTATCNSRAQATQPFSQAAFSRLPRDTPTGWRLAKHSTCLAPPSVLGVVAQHQCSSCAPGTNAHSLSHRGIHLDNALCDLVTTESYLADLVTTKGYVLRDPGLTDNAIRIGESCARMTKGDHLMLGVAFVALLRHGGNLMLLRTIVSQVRPTANEAPVILRLLARGKGERAAPHVHMRRHVGASPPKGRISLRSTAAHLSSHAALVIHKEARVNGCVFGHTNSQVTATLNCHLQPPSAQATQPFGQPSDDCQGTRLLAKRLAQVTPPKGSVFWGHNRPAGMGAQQAAHGCPAGATSN